MKNNYNEFDDFLKKKVGESSFKMNEAHWEDALRRLEDDEDDKKRPILWIFLLGAFVLGALITTGNYILKSSDNKKSVAIHNNMAPIQSEIYSDDGFYEQEDGVLFTQKQLDENDLKQKPEQNNVVMENDQEGQDNIFHQSNFQEARVASNESRYQDDVNNDYPVQEGSIEYEASTKVSRRATKNVSEVKNFEPKMATPMTRTKQKATDVMSMDVKTYAQSNTASNSKRRAKPNVKVENEGRNNGVKSSPLILEANNIGSAGPNVPASMRTNDPNKRIKSVLVKDKDFFRRMNPRYVDGLEDYEAVRIDRVQLNADVSKKIQKVVIQENEAKQETKKLKPLSTLKRQKSSLSLVFGANANQGFGPTNLVRDSSTATIPLTTDNKFGSYKESRSWGVTPMLGVDFTMPISKRLNLSTGLLMTYLNKVNVEERLVQTSYSFDKTMSTFKLERKGIIQLHLPLLFGYRISSKHELMAGPAFTYNLSTYSKVQDFGSLGDVPILGYNQGIKRTDISAIGAYRYTISDRFKLQMSYQFGFGDLLDDSYFRASYKDAQRRVSLGMSWSIFK